MYVCRGRVDEGHGYAVQLRLQLTVTPALYIYRTSLQGMMPLQNLPSVFNDRGLRKLGYYCGIDPRHGIVRTRSPIAIALIQHNNPTLLQHSYLVL